MRRFFGRGMLLTLLIAAALTFTLCNKGPESASGPVMRDFNSEFSAAHPQVKEVMAVQERATKALMQHPEVIGTATGMTDDGQLAIYVLAKSEIPTDNTATTRSLSKLVDDGKIPAEIDGKPVVVYVTGVIHALKGKPPKPEPPDGGTDHKGVQTPPIKLGTSGGWEYDFTDYYCCGGTLGSLVTTGGKLYILSNYHVFYGDQTAMPGTPVIQPGLIDVNCNAGAAQQVALLAGDRSLPGSNVDAAIAEIIPGMVDPTGAILEIGTLSSSTVPAAIGQAVKKSGRTTGLTTSKVAALNATIQVQYDTECAGEPWFVKTFTGQIVITNRASKFLAGGDSGSLMVENVATNPRAVGLLFAGSSQTAVANPINEVLAHFGATMVGN
ncbi:hypothetical protein JW935_20710 [candidate division KSB1 bacterium]|nr:hypothetical protein [candidate division KSB1 bacterium]